MLILNDHQLLLAGGVSLNEPCPYCSQPLRSYPLIMSDDAAQTVYHAACALELATDILVDFSTFFSPPPPYERFFVLTAPAYMIKAWGTYLGTPSLRKNKPYE
jgi:hypothetical protein